VGEREEEEEEEEEEGLIHLCCPAGFLV